MAKFKHLILILIWIFNTNGQTVVQHIFQKAASFFVDPKFTDTEHPYPEYDFIIIGGGSAGSVLANRLSETTNWNILLLEAGDKDSGIANIPITAPFLLLTGYNWGFKSDRTSNECLQHTDGICNMNAGRVLGGSSVINWLIHTRGSPQDFNDWESFGNPGWNYQNMLPYLKKIETSRIQYPTNYNYRGSQGPVSVENSNFATELLDAFLKAGQGLGYPINDPNADNVFGFSKIQGAMMKGSRHSASKAYLSPVTNRTNLHISVNSYVTKIIIEPNTAKAIGVEYVKNKRKYFVRASKEVILSAGAIKSPQLLMLSGIGPKENLNEFNIPVIKDLKVGYNHQEHPFLPGLTFLSSSGALDIYQNFDPRNMLKYFKYREGPLTMPGGSEGIAFIKTNISFTGSHTPDIEIILNPTGVNKLDFNILSQITGFSVKALRQYYGPIKYEQAFNMYPILLQPKSRGRIKLKSKDPYASPSIRLNLVQHEHDIITFIQGIRMVIRLGESYPFKKHNSKFYHACFPGCEHYKYDSDEYWKCVIRNYAYSLQHHSGTCKMGPINDPNSVVNHELKVYGIESLRVVDASVFPTIPSAHTNAIVYAVAEKAADMIKFEWLQKELNYVQ